MSRPLTSAASKSFLKGIPGFTFTVQAAERRFSTQGYGMRPPRLMPHAPREALSTRRVLTLALEVDYEVDLGLHVLMLLFCHAVDGWRG